jgi:hypothetical protein
MQNICTEHLAMKNDIIFIIIPLSPSKKKWYFWMVLHPVTLWTGGGGGWEWLGPGSTKISAHGPPKWYFWMALGYTQPITLCKNLPTLVLAPSLFPHEPLDWPKVTGTHGGLHSGLRPRAPSSVIYFSSGTLKTGLHGFLQNCASLKKVCKKTSKKPALVRGFV